MREALYAAAIDLFRKHGYDAVSVTAVCERAGVAKGTFFNHFPTKDHLLLEWYARLNAAGVVDPPPGPLGERLTAFAMGFLGPVFDDPSLWLEKHRRAGLEPAFRTHEAESDAEVRSQVATLIDEARKDGEIGAALDPDQLAGLFVAMLTGTMQEHAMAEDVEGLAPKLRARIATFARLLAKPR